MRIALMCPMWKRLILTDYVFAYYKRMKAALLPSIELILIAIGSEKKKSKEVAERNGFHYIEYPNTALNKKFNAGAMYAKRYKPDALLLLNSDDIITIDYFRTVKADSDAVWGILDLYAFDFKDRKLGYWAGYTAPIKKGLPIGPGRCFSRKVLNKCLWKPWPQEGCITSGLDGNCRNKLNALGIKITGEYMSDMGCFVVDIKSGINIWAWKSLDYKLILCEDEMKRMFEKAGIIDMLDLNLSVEV